MSDKRDPLPIHFSGDNPVRIRAGEKTQTRRPLRVQPPEACKDDRFKAPKLRESSQVYGDGYFARWYTNDDDGGRLIELRCPYWRGTRTRLYVKEAFAFSKRSKRRVVYRADGQVAAIDRTGHLRECGWLAGTDADREPELRLERKDFKPWQVATFMPRRFSRLLLSVRSIGLERVSQISEEDVIAEGCASREKFLELWDKLYPSGPKSVEADPWVWKVEFVRWFKEDSPDLAILERRKHPKYQEALKNINF